MLSMITASFVIFNTGEKEFTDCIDCISKTSLIKKVFVIDNNS